MFYGVLRSKMCVLGNFFWMRELSVLRNSEFTSGFWYTLGEHTLSIRGGLSLSLSSISRECQGTTLYSPACPPLPCATRDVTPDSPATRKKSKNEYKKYVEFNRKSTVTEIHLQRYIGTIFNTWSYDKKSEENRSGKNNKKKYIPTHFHYHTREDK